MERCTLTARARVQHNIIRDTVDLYVMLYDVQNRNSFIVDSARYVEPGEALGEPTAHLDGSAAQELMDELWRAGVRPTEGKVSDRTLQAYEEHIKSLQAVTKNLFELEKLRI